MDEFTFQCFNPECDVVRISVKNWSDEMASFHPDLLFIESAWEGNSGQWKGIIVRAGKELTELIRWCRDRNIPIVFWNKEDPVHFDSFLNTARMADFVFTTDADCIPRYKEELGTDRVFLLPFAAQPLLHNPIETFDRIDRFSFAGAYYARYVERQQDLRTFTDICLTTKGIDIYDRMQNNPDPRYSFPDEYKPLIVGTLPPDQIDKAYKGYMYAINMNSIKQSSTMFARRVFELLASNTFTVSNYSCGVRNFFGDMIICTDDGKYLRDSFISITSDRDYLDKFRLVGVRKVFSEHTYKIRLNYLLSKVFPTDFIDHKSQAITLLCTAKSDEDVNVSINQFLSLNYNNKTLIFIPLDGYLCKISLPPNVSFYYGADQGVKIGEIVNSDLIAFLDRRDHYGGNYLTDLSIGFSYYSGAIVGKSRKYENKEGIICEVQGYEYRTTGSLEFRSSMISLSRWNPDITVKEILSLICSDVDLEGLGIDRFNYCRNGHGISCTKVDDILLSDTGLSMDAINNYAEKLKPSESSIRFKMNGSDIKNSIGKLKSNAVILDVVGESLQITSKMNEDEILYINLKNQKVLSDLSDGDTINCYLDSSSGLGLSIVLYFFDIRGNRIGHAIGPTMSVFSQKIPDGCSTVSFGLRVQGNGVCSIKTIRTGPQIQQDKAILPKSSTLLLVNQYPSYSDLYRNGFVHRRVVEYKTRKHLIDIFKFHSTNKEECTEYRGINISSGYLSSLDRLLSSSSYDTVLVHFLDEEMWGVLEKYLGRIKIKIWIHGAEVQPWYRRDYNYSSNEEREKAKLQSDKRIKFWKSVFSTDIADLHFIFVSKYFADEVMDDTGVQLTPDRYSVIHNFIDTDLFVYKHKATDQRFKILSIRPFASNKYANDLSVAAILELSKRPIFSKLEFLIIGDGILFEDTVAPLRKFNNIAIEQRFVPQEDIPAIHQKYGIFLVPTRMDSQGVSRDEAMASGLIPVTNAVTAIPEFVDETCGILAPAENYLSMADGIERIANDPGVFQVMSKAASERVRAQSGIRNTIYREIGLIWGSTPDE